MTELALYCLSLFGLMGPCIESVVATFCFFMKLLTHRLRQVMYYKIGSIYSCSHTDSGVICVVRSQGVIGIQQVMSPLAL